MVVTACLVIVALILVNALYVAAEFAAVSVRRTRIRELAADGNPLAAWLLPILETPASLDRYIAACQIGITLSSLILGAFAQRTFAVWLAPLFEQAGGLQTLAAQSTAAVVVLLLLTVAQVVFGELVPKSLALQYPTQSALYTLIPMVPSLWIYRPFIKWLNGSGIIVLKLLGAPPHGHRHVHSPGEIELLIAESRDGGLLEPDEHRRLQRALRLNLRQAKQLMVPRRRISGVEVSTPMSDVVDMVTHSPYSRLLVYRDTIDNVVGVLRTKDVVHAIASNMFTVTIADLMRPIASVHESVTADRVLRQMRERRTHLALVVDEFGGTSGLLTLDDVLSEFLGDLGDEFKAPAPSAEPLTNGRFRLPGAMGVDEAATLLGTTWDTTAATVGGMVTEALGHLPATGDRTVVGDYEFEVERVRDKALESVVAMRLQPSAEAGESA